MRTSHLQKVISTLLIFGIGQNFAVPVPVPVPGGFSQVGFTIYQNKEAAERARNPYKSSQNDGLHSTHKNDRVIVTYSINHPTSNGQQEAVADVSKTFPNSNRHNLFQSHQQHQKHMEMIRLSQMQASQDNFNSNPNTEYVSNFPSSNKYPGQEQKTGPVKFKSVVDYSSLKSASKTYQQQQQDSIQSPSSTKLQEEQRHKQSPYFTSTFDKIPSNHDNQHPVKDVKNLNNIDNLDLKEAFDMNYPLQYF